MARKFPLFSSFLDPSRNLGRGLPRALFRPPGKNAVPGRRGRKGGKAKEGGLSSSSRQGRSSVCAEAQRHGAPQRRGDGRVELDAVGKRGARPARHPVARDPREARRGGGRSGRRCNGRVLPRRVRVGQDASQAVGEREGEPMRIAIFPAPFPSPPIAARFGNNGEGAYADRRWRAQRQGDPFSVADRGALFFKKKTARESRRARNADRPSTGQPFIFLFCILWPVPPVIHESAMESQPGCDRENSEAAPDGRLDGVVIPSPRGKSEPPRQRTDTATGDTECGRLVRASWNGLPWELKLDILRRLPAWMDPICRHLVCREWRDLLSRTAEVRGACAWLGKRGSTATSAMR